MIHIVMHEVVQQWSVIENKLLSLSPPLNEGASEWECTDWMRNLEDLVERAQDTSTQLYEDSLVLKELITVISVRIKYSGLQN